MAHEQMCGDESRADNAAGKHARWTAQSSAGDHASAGYASIFIAVFLEARAGSDDPLRSNPRVRTGRGVDHRVQLELVAVLEDHRLGHEKNGAVSTEAASGDFGDASADFGARRDDDLSILQYV